jgi:hypothetical protein
MALQLMMLFRMPWRGRGVTASLLREMDISLAKSILTGEAALLESTPEPARVEVASRGVVYEPEGYAKAFMQLGGTHEGERRVGHVHAPGLTDPTDDGQPGSSTGRVEPQRTVRTVLVVLDVDAQDLHQMLTPDDQQPVRALGADLRTQRSA